MGLKMVDFYTDIGIVNNFHLYKCNRCGKEVHYFGRPVHNYHCSGRAAEERGTPAVQQATAKGCDKETATI